MKVGEQFIHMNTNYHSVEKSIINPVHHRHHLGKEKQEEIPHSTHKLYRYTHEPITSNIFRYDIPLMLILLFCIFLLIIILSQILIFHTSRFGLNFSSMQKIQDELQQMDKSMENILHDNTLPIDKWRRLFQLQIYLEHFEYLFNLFNRNTHLNKLIFNRSNFIFKQNNKISYFINNTNIIGNQTNSNSFEIRQQKHFCNEQPNQLKGRIFDSNFVSFPKLSLKDIENEFSNVKLGGKWSPSNCHARHKVAIIIPYRDRFEHLITLLYYLHSILQRQELDYKIYVSEQKGNGTYNKGVLMNAAFLYATNEYDFQCFVFHDVDLIPEDDRNMYSCPIFPRHMSVAVDEMNYKLTYEELIGGVLNMPTEHFLAINGYSNLYWGWGAEDDDLYYRLKEASIKVIRPPSSIARYKMLRHTKRTPSVWSKRAKLLYSAAKRYTWDGVSSVRFNLTSVVIYPLFTHITIDVGLPPPGFN